MKFSKNGYYIESYDKCSVCGKLIYEGEEHSPHKHEALKKGSLYCSEWCLDWEQRKLVNNA